MKTLLLLLTFTAAAASQVPCLEDAAPGSPNSTIFLPGMAAPLPYHKPQWGPKKPDSLTYKLSAGQFTAFAVSMPVEGGQCIGSYAVVDDQSDVERTAEAVLSKTNVKPKVSHESIEVMFLDPLNYDAFTRSRQYAAVWSSGRVIEGMFALTLHAGTYYVVLNNRYSLAAKSVTFTLGEQTPPAPTNAPNTPKTRRN